MQRSRKSNTRAEESDDDAPSNEKTRASARSVLLFVGIAFSIALALKHFDGHDVETSKLLQHPEKELAPNHSAALLSLSLSLRTPPPLGSAPGTSISMQRESLRNPPLHRMTEPTEQPPPPLPLLPPPQLPSLRVELAHEQPQMSFLPPAVVAHVALKSHRETLISEGRPATSDVKGNLSPASVVTSEVVKDWLKDRWQAAKNMKGAPIPGPHWVEINLDRPSSAGCLPSRFILDWETAYAVDYNIKGKNGGDWVLLANGKKNLVKTSLSKQHIVHEITVDYEADMGPFTDVRLSINKGATRWGVSLWRFQIWGNCLDD